MRGESVPGPLNSPLNEVPIRIVIADDHAIVREATRTLLDAEPDMRVIGEAGDGVEAIELVEQLDPTLVLMDLSMPRIDGIQATRQIGTIKPTLPILVLSVHDDDQYIIAVIEAGAAGYLLKDIPGEGLVAAIRAVTRGDSVLHPTIARRVIEHFGGDPGRSQSVVDGLTEREAEILRLAAGGLGNDAIALKLGLSTRTIQSHLSNASTKLRVGSRTQAVVAALRQGQIRLEEIE